MPRALLLLALLASCRGFDPTYPIDLACGAGGECPPDQRCGVDQRCHPEDSPDAWPDRCPLGAAQSVTPVPTMIPATLVDTATYAPSCTPIVGGRQTLWAVDLDAPPPHTDLVADVEDQVGETGVDDAVVEIVSGCTSAPRQSCANATRGGAGEVAVLPDVGAGRSFVVVESGPDAKPDRFDYRVRIFTRPVLDATAPCDFALLENRCADDLACVDTAGETRCAALASRSEGDDNESCAGTTTAVADDALITGTISHADRDFIELTPAASVNFRVHLYGEHGGCPGDLKITLDDAACAPQVLASDDDGLGGCTFAQPTGLLDPASKHYLEVSAFESVSAPVPYVLVIDFDWH